MGYRYAQRALAHTYGAKGMPTGHRLVLVVMALHALDGKGKNPDHLPGTYWGGHKQLARECFGSDNDTDMRRVRRALRDLESRQLIRPHDTTTGYNRAYLLLPGGGDI